MCDFPCVTPMMHLITLIASSLFAAVVPAIVFLGAIGRQEKYHKKESETQEASISHWRKQVGELRCLCDDLADEGAKVNIEYNHLKLAHEYVCREYCVLKLQCATEKEPLCGFKKEQG